MYFLVYLSVRQLILLVLYMIIEEAVILLFLYAVEFALTNLYTSEFKKIIEYCLSCQYCISQHV